MKNDLIFDVSPSSGSPYTIDLTEFGVGSSPSWSPKWGKRFSGRPQLAKDIASYIRSRLPSYQDANKLKSGMRNFYRFLDTTLVAQPVLSVDYIEDLHGFEYFRSQQADYKRVKNIIDSIRRLKGLDQLFWPTPRRSPKKMDDELDTSSIRKLYQALKSEAHAIVQMFHEGEELARVGSDPRGVRGGWRRKENHAFVARLLTEQRIPSRQELVRAGAKNLRNGRAEDYFPGPTYSPPGSGRNSTTGITGKLRWFHPGFYDTAVFVWLFMIGTGWNLATVLALDVSNDETWHRDHPQKEGMKVIHSWKTRAGRHQFALSMERPRWHPYQLVKFMVQRTAPLRRTLEHERTELLRKAIPLSMIEQKRLADVDRSLRSPWLYQSLAEVGVVSAVSSTHSMVLNSFIREIISEAGIAEHHPALEHITTSDARDAWIGHAYVESGFNILLARYAAQHSDFTSLDHYLNTKRYKRQGEEQVRKLQRVIIGEVGDGMLIDPVRVRLLMLEGVITPDQEKRLSDVRQRTRLGMGCLNPTNPPRDIAPDHASGTICRVQRCTGCPHGVVFEESLPFLTRARAELVEIQRQIPMQAFVGSSFDAEARSLDETLKQFDPTSVDQGVKSWLCKLASGEAVIHDTHPA